MCTSDSTYEELSNGGPITDSVALRVMTKQDGCICEVSLQNQHNIQTIFMRKYSLLTSAAPEHKSCGLTIDIDYTSPETLKENKTSIECTEGTNTRSFELSKNGVLNFRSRNISGTFSRGYCIQIYRRMYLEIVMFLRLPPENLCEINWNIRNTIVPESIT